jgi:hypothetical protein
LLVVSESGELLSQSLDEPTDAPEPEDEDDENAY